jgi:raffinose/stachyose/melibiose transport system substrate-binding protein
MVYPNNPLFDVDLQTGATSFSDEAWVKTIERYAQLYELGYVNNTSLSTSEAQAYQMFIDGDAAMTFCGTWAYNSLTAQGAVDFERGLFALPANDAGSPIYVSAATSSGYAVNAATAYPDECKAIFEWWFEEGSDLFNAWVESNTSISSYKGVATPYELYDYILNQYNTNGAYYFCNQMWPSGVADEMEAKFAELIGGQGTTAQDVADAMAAKYAELTK